ncbi:cysteine hydrolase [Aquincola sp. MAHUQ-54]|uniref:Cysteine hydrolase n=1 Tax=Aquincola agrisoli TaxID=3119538 RepID=A0AAW9QIR1_9BURK
MHEVRIAQDVLDRALARRGATEVFPTLQPSRTALLVIDLQNGFILPGQPGELPFAREIVGNVNRMAAALRSAGGHVVWVRHTHLAADPWPRFLEFSRAGWGEALTQALTPGRPGHELYAGLEIAPQDEVVDKTRFSALIQGSSDLHERLQRRSIDTVIVAGTITNVCCESTARDAMMLNYKVHFVSDANAARTDAEHNATLGNMMLWFADVRTTEGIVELIDASHPG